MIFSVACASVIVVIFVVGLPVFIFIVVANVVTLSVVFITLLIVIDVVVVSVVGMAVYIFVVMLEVGCGSTLTI